MTNTQLKTLTFHVAGMHCNACILMTESELLDVSYITHAKTNLHRNSVEVTGDFGERSPESIAEDLTKVLIKNGYSLSVDGFDTLTTRKQMKESGWSDFKIEIGRAHV